MRANGLARLRARPWRCNRSRHGRVAQCAASPGRRPVQAEARRARRPARRTCRPCRTRGSRGRAPARGSRFVCSIVNGTICTSKRSAPSPATVRLMPSTAIEPLWTMIRRELRREADRQPVELGFRRAAPRRGRSRRRAPARSGRRTGRRRAAAARGSRALPRGSAPSVVTRSVSGPTSAWISPCSARMTVRHTPLTARLSPGCSSARQRRRDPQAEAAARRLALDQFADGFNEAREHIPPSARPVRAARRARSTSSADENDRPSSSGTPPGPSTCGATYSRTKSTRPSSHAAACSAAPPSSSSDSMLALAERARAPAPKRPLGATSISAPRASSGSRSVAAAPPPRRVVTMMTGPASSVESTRARAAASAAGGRRSRATSGRSRIRAARRQPRIVGEHRARPDADGVHLGANALGVPIGRRRRQRRSAVPAPRRCGRRGSSPPSG